MADRVLRLQLPREHIPAFNDAARESCVYKVTAKLLTIYLILRNYYSPAQINSRVLAIQLLERCSAESYLNEQFKERGWKLRIAARYVHYSNGLRRGGVYAF